MSCLLVFYDFNFINQQFKKVPKQHTFTLNKKDIFDEIIMSKIEFISYFYNFINKNKID